MTELERIYGILTSFLGESKQGRYDSSTTQYQFNCPYCAEEEGAPDGKYNCEVSLQLMVHKCWKCENSGPLSKLIKRFGGRKLLQEYYELVKSLKSNKLYEFIEEGNKIKEKSPLYLPKGFQKINLKTCSDNYLLNYLKKRKIDQWTINKFNIGYIPWQNEDRNWACRIIVPSYDTSGHLNYFVGRDYLPSKENSNYKRIKYKNCDADKKEIVFQEGNIDTDADIYLCEGTFDCLYAPNSIALLGKVLSKDSEVFKFLVENAKAKVIICLDNDTKEAETLKICRLLNETKLSGRIWYVQMNEYKDFGEAYEKDGVHGIAKCLRTAKKYEQDKDF